jgi:hypothetical protein
MKTFLIVSAIVLTLVLAAAGGFWGGIQYQTSKVDTARANFENARGPLNGMPDGGFPSGQMPNRQFQNGGTQGSFFGRGTAGSVKTLEGDTLTLSTAQDVTTVTLTADTVVLKTLTGSTADLQPGLRVMVTGERDSSGVLTASQITILSGDAPMPGAPAPGEGNAPTPNP